jgi:HPt (histidine-containing phosphotransfer) domain-containing protein
MGGTAPAQGKSEPIDLDHLDRQTLGDRTLRNEVLDIFVRQIAGLRAELESTSGDARARLAHRTRGAALGVGAYAIAEGAALLQASPENDDIAAALVERAEEAIRFIGSIRK